MTSRQAVDKRWGCTVSDAQRCTSSRLHDDNVRKTVHATHYRAFERTEDRSNPNLLINKLIWPIDPVQVKLPRKNRTLDNGNYHERHGFVPVQPNWLMAPRLLLRIIQDSTVHFLSNDSRSLKTFLGAVHLPKWIVALKDLACRNFTTSHFSSDSSSTHTALRPTVWLC